MFFFVCVRGKGRSGEREIQGLDIERHECRFYKFHKSKGWVQFSVALVDPFASFPPHFPPLISTSLLYGRQAEPRIGTFRDMEIRDMCG